MTELWVTDPVFQDFKAFRTEITAAQDLVTLNKLKAQVIERTKDYKIDCKNAIDSCIKKKESELYGEDSEQSIPANAQSNVVTNNVLPTSNNTNSSTGSNSIPTVSTPSQPPIVSTPPTPKNVEEVAAQPTESLPVPWLEQLEDSGIKVEPVPAKRTRAKKETAQEVPESIPNQPKYETNQNRYRVSRIIKAPIPGIDFSNNGFEVEVEVSDISEALPLINQLTEPMLQQLHDLNRAYNSHKTVTTRPSEVPSSTPPLAKVEAPTVPVQKSSDATIEAVQSKDADEVFGSGTESVVIDSEKILQEAIDTHNPKLLTTQLGADIYNYKRLQSLMWDIRAMDSIEVTLLDGTQMLLGSFITEYIKEKSKSYPIANRNNYGTSTTKEVR